MTKKSIYFSFFFHFWVRSIYFFISLSSLWIALLHVRCFFFFKTIIMGHEQYIKKINSNPHINSNFFIIFSFQQNKRYSQSLLSFFLNYLLLKLNYFYFHSYVYFNNIGGLCFKKIKIKMVDLHVIILLT